MIQYLGSQYYDSIFSIIAMLCSIFHVLCLKNNVSKQEGNATFIVLTDLPKFLLKILINNPPTSTYNDHVYLLTIIDNV